MGGCAGIQRTVGDLYADARDFIWGGPEDERHPLMVARQDQVDTLIREAQDDYLREVAKRWGTDAKIPTRKLWVHYDPLMVTRAVMDFEGGELRAETLIETDGDRWQALRRLEQTVTGTRAASAADLKALDGTRARAESAAQKQGLALPGADQTFATVPLFEEVLPPEPEGRLEEQPVVGDDGMVRTKLGLVVPFIDGHYGRLAMNFAEPIMRDARRHEVEPSLLLAIMQAESAFNPRATSHIPAYGLMQIVPTSAGLDAYDFVHGMMRLLGPEYLYDPDNNIELGSAYLWILDGRYLRAIENSESRLYCVIAAYNTGAGNVARTFSGTTSVRQAAPVINALTPGEVFARLEQDLPYDETRAYLVKVNGARETYGSWDDALRADHA
ncbi:MAG: transglycosylase SLT domain-containing protein [Geminicoccaceae bacterium]